jgi:hypothetical protein
MSALQNAQQEAMATIDAAKVLVDKVLSIFELVSSSPTLSITFATNPIGYLLQLLEHLGVTYEELRDWLTNYLIYIIPLLEVSVKAIMLTNLKNMITCTADPRIPDKYRKRHKQPDNYNTDQEYGIDINLESIDFYNKLTVNPLSDKGKEWYFGLDGIKDVYKFARAEDFDAFLWFVMHKGHFPNSTKINSMSDISASTDNTLLDVVTCNYNSNSPSRILPGNTFTYDGSAQVISLCIDSTYDKDNNIVENTLIPVSDDWNSVNWYTRRGDYLTKNLGIGKGKPRDYSKECGICNIQFLDQALTQDSPLTGLVNNKFRFAILPKPYVHVPYINLEDLNNSEPPWRFKKLLFNSKGEYDPNGKYTIPQNIGEIRTSDGKIKFTGFTNDPQLTIDIKSGNVTVGNKDNLKKHLLECYPGLTVFEFNYDYVMGMKLFDAKAIATNLINALQRARLGLNISAGYEHDNGTEEIRQILKSIVESDDISIDDCFFEFKNDKYDALLKNAEQRKAKKRDFTNVNQILNEFRDDAELHEQVDVLNRAITQAIVNVTDGIDEQDKFKARFNLVTDLIEQLTIAIVESLFSPKVLMLFEVNEAIMGGKWQKFSVRDLIKAMRDIIISIIKEIRDLIIQELLKMLLKVLSPIIAVLISSLVREQLEAYAEAIDEIIRNCPRIWFSFGRNENSETKLDVVDYADIDMSINKEGESPQLKNC